MNNLNKFGLNMNNNMPMNQNLGVVGGIGPMMNNQQMNMMNPQMNMNFGRNGMSFSAEQIKINPMMNQMRMNQINPQMPMVNGMGPMCMNQMMNPMLMMNPWMMYQMMLMNKPPLTEQQKQNLRMQGYLKGKEMAKKMLAAKAAANHAPAPIVQESPVTGELKIKFNKNGNITIIKMNADNMVAELLNEYFVKTGTKTGNFKFNGNILLPSDITSLSDKGLKNNSEIIVY